MGALEAVILNQVDVQLSRMQLSVLQAIAKGEALTLEQKAAMDAGTAVGVVQTDNQYVLGALLILNAILGGAGAAAITKNSSTKISFSGNSRNVSAWAATQLDSVTDFSIDFEAFISDDCDGGIFGLADSAGTLSGATKVPNGLFVALAGSTILKIQHMTNGTAASSATISYTLSTLYYCTFSRAGNTVTLSVFDDSARTTHHAGSPVTYNDATPTAFTQLLFCSTSFDGGNDAGAYYIQNPTGDVVIVALSGTLISSAIAKDANIGLRYWGDIRANLVAGAAGSTIAMKICNSAGTALHTNYVTIPSTEYARIPLERAVILTATSGSQTVWNFTSLTNADAFINELGVLAKALIVELAIDGTNYTVLNEGTDFAEDISNILAPKITLVSGAGVTNAVSKLRATYIVNIPLSNTTIKLQVQLNRIAVGDTSPSIQPLVGDATKYVSAGQVAIV